MPLRDLLRKKDKLSNNEGSPPAPLRPQTPEFTFVRSDTHTEEIIQPPVFEGDLEPAPTAAAAATAQIISVSPAKRQLNRLRRSSGATPSTDESAKEGRRFSERLRLGSKSRSTSTSSVNIPTDLPTINDPYGEHSDKQEKEAQWEERATILAREYPNIATNAPNGEHISALSQSSVTTSDGASSRPSSRGRARSISDVASDETIQEAIRLHEEGSLPQATEMFGRLAETGNVLSQVLYGLSLRHGWGCPKDEARAVTYLSAAASNSASIESEALKAGKQKGGAAKGELVLAIFELANCFRNGWGVQVDKVAARQYYETAANLGDTDAMNEAAWCYLEGFGGKKDKVGLSSSISSMQLQDPWLVDQWHHKERALA